MRYEVPILYRGQCTFIVEAAGPAEAAAAAKAAFNNCEEAANVGNEWEEVDWIGMATLVPTQKQ